VKAGAALGGWGVEINAGPSPQTGQWASPNGIADPDFDEWPEFRIFLPRNSWPYNRGLGLNIHRDLREDLEAERKAELEEQPKVPPKAELGKKEKKNLGAGLIFENYARNLKKW